MRMLAVCCISLAMNEYGLVFVSLADVSRRRRAQSWNSLCKRANKWYSAIIPCKSFLLNRMNNSLVLNENSLNECLCLHSNPSTQAQPEYTHAVKNSVNYPVRCAVRTVNNDKVHDGINFLINGWTSALLFRSCHWTITTKLIVTNVLRSFKVCAPLIDCWETKMFN